MTRPNKAGAPIALGIDKRPDIPRPSRSDGVEAMLLKVAGVANRAEALAKATELAQVWFGDQPIGEARVTTVMGRIVDGEISWTATIEVEPPTET
jgi:hypothetical protein